MAAYQFYLETIRSKTKPDSFDGLMRDLMSVFVLDQCTTTMKLIQNGQAQEAANIFASMSIGCHQFLDSNDPVAKQAVRYGDRILVAVKKSKACLPLKNAFDLSLKKIKAGGQPAPKDRIIAEMPAPLVEEVGQIANFDEEAPQAELWNTESLCFRYFNLLQSYKATKQVSEFKL